MKRYVWISLISVLLLITLVACNNSDNNNNDETEQSGSTPIEVEKVKKGDLTAERSLFGRVEPNKKTPVMLDAPGEVKDVLTSNGKKVKKDDELLKIEGPTGEQTIKSKASGHVANLSLKKDDFASNEDPVLVILDTNTLSAEFNVTENMRRNFKEDDKVKISHQGDTYEGKVVGMDIVPGETGLFPIEVEIKNDDNKILTGTVVELIHIETLEKDTILIPTASIISELDEDYVYVVNGEKAKRVDVEVLETQSEQSAVKADLTEDDEVIVKGQFIVKDGSQIEVKKGNES